VEEERVKKEEGCGFWLGKGGGLREELLRGFGVLGF
jgi:hypothetical protein